MAEIPVEITYHRQRSSTARIRDRAIHLRISSLMSRREQERHVEELLAKMKGIWERQTYASRKTKLSLQPALESGILSLSMGMTYQLRFKKTDQRTLSVSKIGDTLNILQPIEQEFSLSQTEEALWNFLMKDQLPALKQRLDELAQGWIIERCSKVRMRLAMSRWGSCERKSQVIMLSAKLLLVEPRLLDYVCVHELAHLKYSDHSDLFWDLVSEKMPDWKIQRKRLRGYE